MLEGPLPHAIHRGWVHCGLSVRKTRNDDDRRLGIPYALRGCFQNANMLHWEVVIDVAVHNKQRKLTQVSDTIRRRPRRWFGPRRRRQPHTAPFQQFSPQRVLDQSVDQPHHFGPPVEPKSWSAHTYDRIRTVLGGMDTPGGQRRMT